ncbi:GNAT family N-acetyltransferase [Streptomyces sp. NPDC056224]|uniref:GNAT family N-acetyltransferase n=1 Tax=Streptomyces sp. NPDC056224 TaxID=3345750 RepID=UPI0035E1F572
MTLPESLAVKSASEVPLDSLVDFVRSYEESITGIASYTREDILLETGHPGYDPLHNSWCLLRPQGDVMAWAALTVRGGTSLDGALTVLPGDDGDTAARELLGRLLRRTEELDREHGSESEITIGGVLTGDPVVPRVLEESGFRRQASFTQAEIDLTSPPVAAVLPEGARVRPIGTTPQDVRAVYQLHVQTRAKGTRTLDYETFRARLDQFGVATEEGVGIALLIEIAGRPVGHVLAYAGDGQGRIVDVGVSPASRGLGIGLALVVTALAGLRGLGCHLALLALDSSRIQDLNGLYTLLSVKGSRAVTHYVKRPT